MVPVDDLFARLIALLAANLGEEGGEAVIIILGPALEGMIVALGALDAHSQKELGGGLDGALRVAADPVVVGGGVRVGRAVGGQEHADKRTPAPPGASAKFRSCPSRPGGGIPGRCKAPTD